VTIKNKFKFHPLEISFCGYSGTGKTTLISKIIKQLSSMYKIGFLKHDAHIFDMDHKGKDTFKMSKAGASSVLITSDNEKKRCVQSFGSNEFSFGESLDLIDNDFLIIEGYKHSNIPKILFLDEQSLKEYNESEIDNVLAIITTDDKLSVENTQNFDRNDVDKICDFLINYFLEINSKTSLAGLILGGGKSSRMGEDKTSLNYHGLNQVDFISSLFSSFEMDSYISCRKDQEALPHFKDKNLIFDLYNDFGPAAGIVSALKMNKDTAFLTVACDLPFIDRDILELLIKNRNPFKNATCFYNRERKWNEPLVTIYEPKSFYKLSAMFALNKYCPRKMLRNCEIEQVELPLDFLKKIDNINTPIEKENALKLLNEMV